ncbi:MAG TPA: signal peptidase II, partial [Casimicrobiaceae bacterium]|nr:signal peptidase II [Casimicrobiaceae bacterium]
MRVPTSANLRWLWLAVLVVALDQLTKHLIVASFRPGEELPLTPFASLVLAFNRGAAFSFLAGSAGWQRWLFALIAVVACVAML